MVIDRYKYNKPTATIFSTIAISVLATAGITISTNDVSAQQTYNRFADYCLHYDNLASAKDKATVKRLLEIYAVDGYSLSVHADTTEKTTWDKIVGTDVCYSAEEYYKQYKSFIDKPQANVPAQNDDSSSNHQVYGLPINTSGLAPLIGFDQLQELSVRCEGEATNLETIATLTNLEKLELIDCEISDASFLSGLTKLVVLNLGGNSIKDLTPLASLTNLEYLALHNQVDNALKQQARAEDIPFMDGYFQGYLVDLSPLTSLTKLKTLSLGNNSIKDVSPLNSLPKLIGVNLSNNKITDISSLSPSSLPRLLELEVSGNYIPPEARVCPFEGSIPPHASRCIGLDEQATVADSNEGEPLTTPEQTRQPTNTVNSTPTSPASNDSPNESQQPSVLDEVNRGVEETIEQAPGRILDGLF